MENEELSQHLVAAKDAQKQLTVEVTSTSLRCSDHIFLSCQVDTRLFDLNSKRTFYCLQCTAPGAGGEIFRVYRDAAWSPGGAEEPEEQELPCWNAPTLPSPGPVPHGEGPCVSICVCVCAFVYTWNHPSVVHKFLCCRILWQLRSREQWGRSWVWMIPSVRSRSMYGRLSVNDCMWFILRAVCCTGTDIWNCDRKIPNWFDTNSYEGFT